MFSSYMQYIYIYFQDLFNIKIFAEEWGLFLFVFFIFHSYPFFLFPWQLLTFPPLILSRLNVLFVWVEKREVIRLRWPSNIYIMWCFGVQKRERPWRETHRKGMRVMLTKEKKNGDRQSYKERTRQKEWHLGGHTHRQMECKRQRDTERETGEQLNSSNRRIIVWVPVGQEFTGHWFTAGPNNTTMSNSKDGIYNWSHKSLKKLAPCSGFKIGNRFSFKKSDSTNVQALNR